MARSFPRVRLGYFLGTQGSDLFGSQAELPQYVGGVLAALRRGLRAPRATAERDRTAHKIERAEPPMVHPQPHIECFDLGIPKHLVDAIDRTAWHPGFVEQSYPVADGISSEPFLKDRVQRVAIARAQFFRREFRAIRDIAQFQCGADPAPHRFAATG